MTKKIDLVTGGAGFIGSNLVIRLVEEGRRVRVLDNLSTGRLENLESVKHDIDLIEGDIRDLPTVQKCMEGIACVFHQAALPSVPRSIEDPLQSNETNITGTLHVLLAARDNRVKRLIFASSSSVYGDTQVLPKIENMPPSLLSPYALNKMTGEYYCKLFASEYGLETISLRYFNVFGPRQSPTSDYAAVIPKFITALLTEQAPIIYGDGEQTRDFTYIDNVVEANLLAAQVDSCSGQILNIATGERISLNNLVRDLESITKTRIAPDYAEPRRGDVRHSLADISQARSFLGYDPTVDFRSGLLKTLEWFRDLNR
jgi:nucleoside-diphosphate-sugar epimerase